MPRIELLVVQPTPFCNIDCRYCYLPQRKSKAVATPETLSNLFSQVFASGWARRCLSVVWHAGEPMVLPIEFYQQAFAIIDRLKPPELLITHSFQTNGTLVNVTEFLEAGVVVVVLLGSSVLGLIVHPLLSERHRTREVTEFVQLVVYMLVTFAALVLGLLTTSVKASFDQVGNDLNGLSIQLIRLDQCLREWGVEAVPIRRLLRAYTAAAIATTWTEEPRPPGDYYPTKASAVHGTTRPTISYPIRRSPSPRSRLPRRSSSLPIWTGRLQAILRSPASRCAMR